MEELTIQDIMAQPADLVVQAFKERQAVVDYKTYAKQYDPDQHDVHDETIRPKKIIKKDGATVAQDVTRLSMPFQKIIVDRAAAFLIGNGINIITDPASDAEQEAVNQLKKIWHDNKCDYRSRQIARVWMSETEAAEYWYIHEKNGELKPRIQVWARSMGDDLYPYFDEYGDLAAFGRGYKIGGIEHLDVWTSEWIYSYRNIDRVWITQDPVRNVVGKIPVIYYSRERPEWSDVQPMIDRYEKMISNYSDANDYFASPMIVVKGQVHGFAEKGEQGKIITTQENADVRYLTWDQAPEAIRLEEELLRNGIMSLSQTPDISFREMKGLGSAISGTALEMMFMDAMLKSLKHQEEFGEGVQRRMNLIKAIMQTIDPTAPDIHVEPEFVFYMPRNEEELVRMLVTATGNRAILSQKTAVENSPFTINAERELEEVKADEAGFFGNIVP